LANLVGIIDQSPDKLGCTLKGIPIYGPDQIAALQPHQILINVQKDDVADEIERYLQTLPLRADVVNVNKLLRSSEILYGLRPPLYADQFPLIMFWSHKSGCTTLMKWFYHQLGMLDHITREGRTVHDFQSMYYADSHQWDRLEHELCVKKSKRVFKLVRNPYTRAVSSFLMLSNKTMAENKQFYLHGEWAKIRKFFYGDEHEPRGITFKQFLLYVKESGSDLGKVDSHFAKQYVSGEEDWIDEHIKLEDFSRHIREIERSYGLKPSPVHELSRSDHNNSEKMVSDGRNMADELVTEETFAYQPPPKHHWFYDDEAIRLVNDIYRDDFIAYQYEFRE